MSLHSFLERRDHRLLDVYRGNRSWTQLRREAGRSTLQADDGGLEALVLKSLSRLTHLDDPERVAFYGNLLNDERPPGEASVR